MVFRANALIAVLLLLAAGCNNGGDSSNPADGPPDGQDTLTRVGITCALCHSTVDSSFAPGIGKRLDGWPNRDLNPGAIIALSPALTPEQKAVFNSWGKGKYDPRFNLDGKNGAAVIAPAFGLFGVHKVTFTGDGDRIAYWNRYVAVTQMGGHGAFSEQRTGVNVGAKLTDANDRLHPVTDSVAEPEPNGAPSYVARSATKQYRTTPLHGLWQHPPYFHNGSAALEAAVQTYNARLGLGLSAAQMADLVQYLKSL